MNFTFKYELNTNISFYFVIILSHSIFVNEKNKSLCFTGKLLDREISRPPFETRTKFDNDHICYNVKLVNFKRQKYLHKYKLRFTTNAQNMFSKFHSSFEISCFSG